MPTPTDESTRSLFASCCQTDQDSGANDLGFLAEMDMLDPPPGDLAAELYVALQLGPVAARSVIANANDAKAWVRESEWEERWWRPQVGGGRIFLDIAGRETVDEDEAWYATMFSSALHIMARDCHDPAMVREAIERAGGGAALLEAKDERGWLPIDTATQHNRNTKVVQMLLHTGGAARLATKKSNASYWPPVETIDREQQHGPVLSKDSSGIAEQQHLDGGTGIGVGTSAVAGTGTSAVAGAGTSAGAGAPTTVGGTKRSGQRSVATVLPASPSPVSPTTSPRTLSPDLVSALKVGDAVTLDDQYTPSNPKHGCLTPGEVGRLVQISQDPEDDEPFKVIGRKGEWSAQQIRGLRLKKIPQRFCPGFDH